MLPEKHTIFDPLTGVGFVCVYNEMILTIGNDCINFPGFTRKFSEPEIKQVENPPPSHPITECVTRS